MQHTRMMMASQPTTFLTRNCPFLPHLQQAG